MKKSNSLNSPHVEQFGEKFGNLSWNDDSITSLEFPQIVTKS